MKEESPPKISLKFLRWFCDEDLLEDVEGDLQEVFQNKSAINKRAAKLNFIKQVIFLFRPGIIKSFEGQITQNNYGMLKNYLKTTWRNLMKSKGLSTINISSLSIGMAACLLIFLFVNDERSFDRFHSQNIYRLCEVQSFPGKNTQKVALTMPGIGPTMTDEFPEIEKYTRFWNYNDQLIEKGDKRLRFNQVTGGDSTFFEIFDFEFISGDRKSA